MTTKFTPTTAAEQLLFLLGANGIEHLFLNPGTDSAPLQEAMKTLPAAGVPMPVIHPSTFESVSLAAAHAYYQATGKPACVFVHVDAGTQNLGAIVHDVFRDHAGVVILAGLTPYAEDPGAPGGRSGYIQWLQDMPDQAGIVRGYAKCVFDLTRTESMDRVVGRAVQLATGYPAGPGYVTVARDVLMDPPVARPLRTTGFSLPAPPAIDSATLSRITKLVAAAKRPLLITSRLGRTTAGFDAVVRFAELAGVTVIRGADTGPVSIPTLHPMHRRSAASKAAAIREADCILIVECEVPYIPRFVQPDSAATVIHIDPDPLKATMPLWTFRTDLSVTADGPTAIGQITAALEPIAEHSTAVGSRFRGRLRRAGAGEPLPTPVRPKSGRIGVLEVFAALNDVLDAEDIVVEEAITNGDTLYENLVRTLPRTIAGAFAPGLGWSLGGAIGVKLARPDRRVVAVCGDGAFLFSVPASALMLSAEMRCPFLAVILNNGGYRASRLPVYELFPSGASVGDADAVGTRFVAAPDFAELAQSCHAYGERVEKREDLLPALERGLAAVDAGRSAVIDIHIEQN
jgi:acetolactate synthase-1/2/3 large subunit